MPTNSSTTSKSSTATENPPGPEPSPPIGPFSPRLNPGFSLVNFSLFAFSSRNGAVAGQLSDQNKSRTRYGRILTAREGDLSDFRPDPEGR